MSNTIKERLTKLETHMEDLLQNHLPHLDTKIDKVQDKLDKGQWFVLVTLIGVVVELALLLLK